MREENYRLRGKNNSTERKRVSEGRKRFMTNYEKGIMNDRKED